MAVAADRRNLCKHHVEWGERRLRHSLIEMVQDGDDAWTVAAVIRNWSSYIANRLALLGQAVAQAQEAPSGQEKV